jgi:alkylation response protein AidB-like acyl-CoA dehydrogenase
MDFELTEEQRAIRDLARDFAEREIIPQAQRWNEEHRCPTEVFRKMADLGFMGMLVPDEYGGTNTSTLTYAAITEEFGRADVGVAATWNGCNTISILPFLEGTEEQKQRWLVPMAVGKELGCFSLNEPSAGSDARSVQTRAVLHGDEWIINGTKNFASTAGTDMSNTVVLLAVTKPGTHKEREFSALVVTKDTPGYSMGPPYHKLGWHTMDSRDLFFQDCRVPRDHLLGREGGGLRQFLAALQVARIGLAAIAVGLIRACLETSLDYARQRVQFGQPISKFQAIQFKLAEMAMDMELARLMVYKTAWLRDKGLPFAQEASIAKLFASNACMKAAEEAVQILGGYGYVEESPVARYFRDAKNLKIGGGTSEIHHLLIARNLGC